MKRVIIISGAIACGKTTVGKALTKIYSDKSNATVFLDLDSEVEKLSPGFEWEHEDLKQHDLSIARKIMAERTNSAIHLGHNVVLVGPFFTKDDMHDYLKFMESGIQVYLFQLSASLEVRAARNLSRPESESLRREILEQQVMIEQIKHPIGTIVDGNLTPDHSIDEILSLVEKNTGVYPPINNTK